MERFRHQVILWRREFLGVTGGEWRVLGTLSASVRPVASPGDRVEVTHEITVRDLEPKYKDLLALGDRYFEVVKVIELDRPQMEHLCFCRAVPRPTISTAAEPGGID